MQEKEGGGMYPPVLMKEVPFLAVWLMLPSATCNGLNVRNASSQTASVRGISVNAFSSSIKELKRHTMRPQEMVLGHQLLPFLARQRAHIKNQTSPSSRLIPVEENPLREQETKYLLSNPTEAYSTSLTASNSSTLTYVATYRAHNSNHSERHG